MSGITDVIGAVAPWITAAITGGPVGVAVKAASSIASALGLTDSSVSGVTKAVSDMTLTGDQKIALQTAENDFQFKMKAAGYANVEALAKTDLDTIAAINATMVQELQNSKQESWLQKSWRPLCGISVAAGSFLSVLIFGYVFYQALVNHDVTGMAQLPALATSIAIILGVPGAAVGIVAWHKGVGETAAIKAEAGS